MSFPAAEKIRSRADYPYLVDYRTRWNDNDMYNHINNSIYNFPFDSAVNSYLIAHCGLQPSTSPYHALVVHTSANFFSSFSYPSVAEVGVCVIRLGSTSVRYEVAFFEKGIETVKAIGELVHVFVDKRTGNPSRKEMSTEMQIGLQRICRPEYSSGKLAKL